MQSIHSSRPAVDEYESHEQQEIDVMGRDKKCQCDQDESTPQIGHGHDPASLEAVSERAGRQRQHEPRERVRCCDRRHRKRVRVHEESKEGNCPVAEAVAEARYRKGCPEIAEPSPERSTSPGVT